MVSELTCRRREPVENLHNGIFSEFPLLGEQKALQVGMGTIMLF
jgi:hypothetical protein